MNSKMEGAETPAHNFEPSSDWIQEDDCDTLVLYLPGFKREQLRVQRGTSDSGTFLRIKGSKPLGKDTENSFQKDFPVSANCNITQITAKFEGSRLFVRLPKLTVSAEKKIPPEETAPASNVGQEQATTQKTTSTDDQNNKQTSFETGERTYGRETIDSSDKDQKAAATTASDEQEKVSGYTDAVLEDRGTNRSAMAEVDRCKLNARSPEVQLKMARRTVVLAFLFAFVLGVYLGSNLSWLIKKSET